MSKYLRSYQRKTPRLQGFDYSQPGAYFFTTNLQSEACLFGDVSDGKVLLNAAGEMVWHWWSRLPTKFNRLTLDEFIVMPNHIHGLLFITSIVGEGPSALPADLWSAPPQHDLLQPTNEIQKSVLEERIVRQSNSQRSTALGGSNEPQGGHMGTAPTDLHSSKNVYVEKQEPDLIKILQWFKTMTTNAYIRGVKEQDWPRFEGQLWQRSFHDKIVRLEKDLVEVRSYIAYNPQKWGLP